MPDDRTPARDSQPVLIVSTAALALLLALVTGLLLLSRIHTQDETALRPDGRGLRSFNAERISAEIAQRGPVLFVDTTGGEQDFIVQTSGRRPE